MAVLILKPAYGEAAYEQAADVFAEMYEKVTGEALQIAETDDGSSDLVVIGSDSVNDFLMDEMFAGRFDDLHIRYGTDDYCMRSYQSGDRKVLVLAGGRGRSTIYAVYDYFERFAGCRYFWDGDVIAHRDVLPMEEIDVKESPRFEYRGLRYFAHRGLKRFQAEHWSWEDWKQEIDWMMKKRLNFFMLRIGMDDAWQRAFPDIVPYPEEYRIIEDEIGYDDRSDFWTLKYKGELRIRVMEYAKANDIMSPTDCGTMTHWYARTPVEFLKAKTPKLLGQADNQYNEFETGRVFDFRLKENMDYYMKLTETMAEQYEQQNTSLFHTIGLGERRMYPEDRENFMLKKFCYRRIAENIRKHYPNSKLFLASWDFVGWWRPQEVQELMKELDPERTIILDYTSEGTDEIQNFTNWGVVHQFPWIYGLFHAYESESELRGQYDIADERLKIAAEDPFCKGMILWPELSHSDPIVLEYLSANAWSPLEKSLETLVEEFCSGRYGSWSEQMNGCWQSFLPFMKLSGWGGYTKVENGTGRFQTDSTWHTHSDIWVKPIRVMNCNYKNERMKAFYSRVIPEAKTQIPALCEIIQTLAKLNAQTEDAFIKRDSIDIVRTVCGRFLNYMLAEVILDLCEKEKISAIQEEYRKLIDLLSDLIWKNPDFSVYSTLQELEETAPVNPKFERTLKQNILNQYCQQCCSELIDHVFKEEAELVFEFAKNPYDREILGKKSEAICAAFHEKPLADMQRQTEKSVSCIMNEIAQQVQKLTSVCEIK